MTFSAAADAPGGDGDGDAVRGWTALAFIATDNNLACGGRQNVENMLIGLSTNATNATDDGTSSAAKFTVGAFIDETGYKPFTKQCPWSFPSSWILDKGSKTTLEIFFTRMPLVFFKHIYKSK